MADKEFKTTKEQLDILRERGLTITDENKAKDLSLTLIIYFLIIL